MKRGINFLGVVFLFFSLVVFSDIKVHANEQSYENFYGITWSGKPAEDMKYARQMGYDYIAINPTSTPKDYHKNPDCTGLKFYLTDPYFYSQVLSGYNKTVDVTKPISDAARDFYNQYMVWKSNEAFPENLATGYHPAGDSTKFSIMWDFQQQAVIDEVVEKIIKVAKSYENRDMSFTFGGYIIDEPKLAGEFYRVDENGNNISVDLSHWTGVDSGLVHDTITHEYATYSEGKAAFYKKLRVRMAQEFSNPKWIVQPTVLYSDMDNNEWIYQIKDRADKDELTPDMLSQKSRQNTYYVDDTNNFNSGVNITKDKVGNSQTGEFDEYKNRLFAAKAGINGAWYNWFGRFGCTGDILDLQSITEVHPSLKLIRCLPNWDNLNNVSLGERSWDDSVYQSTKSYASSDVMHSRHPKTGKLFVVFLTLSGVITLNAGESVASVQRTDGFFVETGEGSADVSIVGNEIRLKNKDNIGKGYIITVSADGDQSTVVAGSETGGTSSSETSKGTGNGSGLSDTTRVEYSPTGKLHSSISVKQRTKTRFSQQSVSTQQTWQRVAKRTQAQKTAGLSGGEGWQLIYDIAYAPSNPNIVYLTTDTNQVWNSVDGGTSWQKKASGFNANGGISVIVDPTNANIAYVAGSAMATWAEQPGTAEGIFRTTNGGTTWTNVKTTHFHGRQTRGKNFAFAGSTIYAGPYSGGLLKSTNGGTAWNLVPKSGGGYILDTTSFFDIKAHPRDNTVLYASTGNGKFYKIVDSGGSATVTQIGTGLPGLVADFEIDPKNTNIMYAAVGTSGVYKSTNGGLNFSAINNGLSTPLSMKGSVLHIAISPTDSNKLLINFPGLWGNQLYYTTNGGSSWTQTSSMDEQNADGWVCGSIFKFPGSTGVNVYTSPITFHPTNGNLALTAGFGSQVKKTTDGGVNWRYSNTGYTGSTLNTPGIFQAISWDPNNPNRATFFHGDFGALLTTNNEDTFTKLTLPLFNGREENNCGAMNGNTIIVSSGEELKQCIAVSWNAGQNWTQFPNYTGFFKFVSFHPQNSNVIYVDNYKSTDNGHTWKSLSRDVKGIYRGNGNIVYSFAGSTIYKSTDAGATWTTPYPSLSIPSWCSVSQIAIDPSNQNRIYAAVRDKGVYIITNTVVNGGTVLLRNDAHGLTKDRFDTISCYSIVTDPIDSKVVYVGGFHAAKGHSNGIFCSTDAGMTWTNITGNLGPEINVTGITVNPHNRYVYLSTYAGTWKLPPPGTGTTETTPPTVTITSPTSAGTYSTNQATINIGGTASDNSGITNITWSNSKGGSGTANGTTSWSVSSVSLSSGDNVITITAKDGAGNTGKDTITINVSGTTITTGPRALYRFDERSGTVATDSSGNGNNGTINGATWTTGKSGGALSFDGIDDNVQIPGLLGQPQNVTISAWANLSARDTSGSELVSLGDHVTIRLDAPNGRGAMGFYYDGTTWRNTTTGISYAGTGWHHFVYVVDDTNNIQKVYVDGVVKGSTANTQSISYAGLGWNTFIGKHGNGDTVNDLKGFVDEVRIYNRALSGQEIQDLYNAFTTIDTTAPHCSISINNGASYTNATLVTLALSATDDVGVTGYYLSTSPSMPLASAMGWILVSSTTNYSESVSYTLSSGDGNKTVYVWYKDAAGNVSTAVSDSITLDTTATMIQTLYTFNEGSGTIANDSSGNGNHGTINGATWTTGKSGWALSFNGNNTYVKKATPSLALKPSSQVAISAWIKTNGVDTYGSEIASMGDSYALRINPDGKVKFFYYNGFEWKSVNTTGINVIDGLWHHIVGQKTSVGLEVYVDGVLKGNISNTGTIAYTLGKDFFIGKHGNVDTVYDFKGIIDDVRVYDRALNTQEIQNLYNF